ncbi:MAG: hypothetical protein AB1894_08765 [Chloroflexota bacterium]
MRIHQTLLTFAACLLAGAWMLSACQTSQANVPTATPPPTLAVPTNPPPSQERLPGDGAVTRSLLTYANLLDGFEANSPVDEAALTLPENAAHPEHSFDGRLELLDEESSGGHKIVSGSADQSETLFHLPPFDFAFVQNGSYLIPVQRGAIVAEHPDWNIFLEPGRAWQEDSDQGWTRASLPFALTVKGGNATFNGTLTFLFSDQQISRVWYQVTQETDLSPKMDLWGLLEAAYHPETLAEAGQVRQAFDQEMAQRFPTRPIEKLAEDYPGVNLQAFGSGVTPGYMTYYGFVINGVNYVGGCRTRYGVYPYCESMRASSYSTAKSLFPSLALMRLAQKYDPQVGELLIKDYVPEAAQSPGDWEKVTFNNTLDMATGKYGSDGFMIDDEGGKMGEFFAAQPYAGRIAKAFDWPDKIPPGERWVYRTSDTFIVTRAMQNYLQTQQGSQADIFQFVVDEIYRPLKLSPGATTSMRTADDNWQGQAEGGYGLWWTADDIAKLAWLLNDQGGQIDGVQVLNPNLLADAMQQDPSDRGVDIDTQRKYNNAFWAQKYGQREGFACEFWVPHMLGISGNVVALFPNGTAYYYFSDNREFTWLEALRTADKLIPLCP